MLSRAGGVLLFLLLMSCLAAYILKKYLTKNTSPEEELHRAIDEGEIVPFINPSSMAKTARCVVWKCWPDGGIR